MKIFFVVLLVLKSFIILCQNEKKIAFYFSDYDFLIENFAVDTTYKYVPNMVDSFNFTKTDNSRVFIFSYYKNSVIKEKGAYKLSLDTINKYCLKNAFIDENEVELIKVIQPMRDGLWIINGKSLIFSNGFLVYQNSKKNNKSFVANRRLKNLNAVQKGVIK